LQFINLLIIIFYLVLFKNKSISFEDNQKDIKRNINYIKDKLQQNTSKLSNELLVNINKININNLTWKDPIANRIISDDSIEVKNLSNKQHDQFMQPKIQMIFNLPDLIKNQCNKFVKNYTTSQYIIPEYLSHNKQWKENGQTLKKITESIFDIL
jgi:hypothetical protein